MRSDAVAVLCFAALLVRAEGARRHGSAVEERVQRASVTCPMKAEAFGFQWQYSAKTCLECNPISAFNKQMKNDLFSAIDCTKGKPAECAAFKKPKLCACVPATGNGKARFAYFMHRKKCDNEGCFKQFGDLQSKMHGYVVSFTPNAFENPMSRCKLCKAATSPAEREELDCDGIRLDFGALTDTTRTQMEEMGVEINEEFNDVDLKEATEDEEIEEEEEEDNEPDEEVQDEEMEDDAVDMAASPPTASDEEIYDVPAIVAEVDTPEELQAVMESPCPPKVLWNVAGYPRCREAATKRFVMTKCCAVQMEMEALAGKMCSKLIGSFDLPRCRDSAKPPCKMSPNNCKVAGNKPKKVFKRAGIPGTFPKGYGCKVNYMCDFPDRPAVGPMTGPKCNALGGQARNMCTATAH